MRVINAIFYVSDIFKSIEFYEKLGFKISKNMDKQIDFKMDEQSAVFSIIDGDSARKEPGKQVCRLGVPNIGGLYEKYKLLGIPLVMDLTDKPYGRTFAIKDIDGNRLEFVQDV